MKKLVCLNHKLLVNINHLIIPALSPKTQEQISKTNNHQNKNSLILNYQRLHLLSLKLI